MSHFDIHKKPPDMPLGLQNPNVSTLPARQISILFSEIPTHPLLSSRGSQRDEGRCIISQEQFQILLTRSHLIHKAILSGQPECVIFNKVSKKCRSSALLLSPSCQEHWLIKCNLANTGSIQKGPPLTVSISPSSVRPLICFLPSTLKDRKQPDVLSGEVGGYRGKQVINRIGILEQVWKDQKISRKLLHSVSLRNYYRVYKIRFDE